MALLNLGSTVTVPDLPGRWSVWSQEPAPASWFVIPADADARATGRSYVTIRATMPAGCASPEIKLLDGEVAK